MRLSFQLSPEAEAGQQALAICPEGRRQVPLSPPAYDGRPYDTAELSRRYNEALDTALAMGACALFLPTLGLSCGWPPQFAVPAALVAVDAWQQAHPLCRLTVTLWAPDRRCYELYEEFAPAEFPGAGHVVGFFHEYGPNGWLSNWYPTVFTAEGTEYLNAEQYLMHQKALCCADAAVAARILENPDPKTVKLLGRSIAHYDEEKWAEQRQEVIFRGLLAKFSQNSGLQRQLLTTGDRPIAECSPNDCIWGIGLGLEDPRCQDPSQWQGQNILGNALMKVRAALKP